MVRDKTNNNWYFRTRYLAQGGYVAPVTNVHVFDRILSYEEIVEIDRKLAENDPMDDCDCLICQRRRLARDTGAVAMFFPQGAANEEEAEINYVRWWEVNG